MMNTVIVFLVSLCGGYILGRFVAGPIIWDPKNREEEK